MPPSPYRTPEAAIRADVEWKLAILTVPRRIALGVDLREELERLEKEARDDMPGAWPDLSRVCEQALTESATKLEAPRDQVTSLIRSQEDPSRYQLFVAVPNALPDVDIGLSGIEGHAELARWLLDRELEAAIGALGEIDPRVSISDGDAYISWIASDVDPDPALPEVTRILLAIRDRVVVASTPLPGRD